MDVGLRVKNNYVHVLRRWGKCKRLVTRGVGRYVPELLGGWGEEWGMCGSLM